MRALCGFVLGLFCVACGPKQIDPGGGGPDSSTEELCAPGASESCYTGPSGTEGIGECRPGTRTCSDAGQWSACGGEIIPVSEICANAIDDNCSGIVDENVDEDGDGFTTCDGDCCDAAGNGCATPNLVNPGAFEAMGNGVDDDCDGMIDNVLAAACDSGLPSNSGTANDYAKAIELCQTATETVGDRRWGVVDARIVRADGTGAPNANQRAIRPVFGGAATQGGAAMVVLSTGHAAALGQTAPGYLNFQTGNGMGTTSGFPADFLAAHGGTLPNSPGCPAPDTSTGANDPVMLQLRVRTPTNARSFSFSINFQSSEFPEWTCSPFNDFFVVLLDSTFAGSPPNPTDKNLAFYTNGAQTYPVGVNLAFGNTGLFRQCVNGSTGCAVNSVPGTITTCTGTNELVGTGMDQANPPAHALATGQPGSCSGSNLLGGGTGWLVTSGNVVGGEIITLRIALWDTSDGIYDSIAILDNFQWSVEASEPGTILQ